TQSPLVRLLGVPFALVLLVVGRLGRGRRARVGRGGRRRARVRRGGRRGRVGPRLGAQRAGDRHGRAGIGTPSARGAHRDDPPLGALRRVRLDDRDVEARVAQLCGRVGLRHALEAGRDARALLALLVVLLVLVLVLGLLLGRRGGGGRARADVGARRELRDLVGLERDAHVARPHVG